MFDSDGFASFGLAVPERVLNVLDELTVQIIAGRTPEEAARERSLGSLVSMFTRPAFSALILETAIRDRFRELGFDDLRFSAGYFLSKPAHSPATFWHQDWGFWNDPVSYEREPRQLGLLLYLQDVDATNGCPRFIAGSHLRHHPMHNAINHDDPTALRRVDDPTHVAYGAVEGQVAFPARRGELVLFDPRVLHGAHANRSGQPRHGLTMWFFTGYESLAAPIRSFVSNGDPIAHWPEPERSRLRALLPTYDGSEAPTRLVKRPDGARMR